MTVSKEYTIWCDGDCPEWVRYQVVSASYATKRARDDGWVSPEWGEHYCPSCAEERRSTAPDTNQEADQ